MLEEAVEMIVKILASKPLTCSSEIKDSFVLSFELNKQIIRPWDFKIW